MKGANAVLFSLLMIVSSLAGCIGGEELDSSDLEQQIADLENNQDLTNQTIADLEQTIIAQQNENDELRASIEMMNQTLIAQALLNAEIQQAMEDMNATNAERIQNLLSTIVGIQLNISSSQTALSSLVYELENLNSSDSDLLAQLNATQNYLDSLDSELNTTIADLMDEINSTGVFANWAYWSLRVLGIDLIFQSDNFSSTYLIGYDFRFMNLSHVNLSGANLARADFRGAILTGANFSDVNLEYARTSQVLGCPNSLPNNWACKGDSLVGPSANLTNADLAWQWMANIDLSNTDLSNADLHNANLDSANLSYSNLSNANLREADLTNAVLLGADLTGAILTGVYWGNTTCPDGTNSDSNGYTCVNNL